eukprot:CAMPEP_0116078554 /NCGR_PEP_ID=MMETSP0327-20121206/669_1 /TAXON_ID=44447 /ORGANISM="Pseudo-nitzschia delicatissima, Strain B596" /LENGTH=1243 /DNA_ID=CAMNT_0003569117 /DNA_START=108 /DNA_END=3839 /DNA_ORIENTATION=-
MNGGKRETKRSRGVIEISSVENSQSNGNGCIGDSVTPNDVDTTMQEYSSPAGNALRNVLVEESQPLPPNSLIQYQKQKHSSSPRKQSTSAVAATSHSRNSKESDSSSSVNGIGGFKRTVQSPTKTSGSDNVVTSSMTRNSSSSTEWQEANQTTTSNTTSSGSGGDDDDRGSSTKPESMLQDDQVTSNSSENLNESGVKFTSKSDADVQGKMLDLPPRKKARHHPQGNLNQRSWIKSPSLNDDGSNIQVPGDDGSDRIVAGDIDGGVPIKPATVVASRLFRPHTTETDHSTSSSAVGTGGKRTSPPKSSAENQHHLLLPPHREPRYHTIRSTLYRFKSSDRNDTDRKHSRSNRGNSRRRGAEKKVVKSKKDKTDPSSTEEITNDTVTSNTLIFKHRHHHHHRGVRSGDSSSSRSVQKAKTKRHGEKLRSIRSPASTTPSDSARSLKSKNSNLTSPDSYKERNAGGSSSGSGTDGTEDGYAGSVSSNENGSGNQQLGSSSPSPSETSSEECEQQEGERKENRRRRKNHSKQKSSSEYQELSSEIADFGSSGSSETMDEDEVGNSRRGGNSRSFGMKSYQSSTSSSQSLSSSNFSESGSDGLEMAYLSAKRDADAEHERMLKMITRKKKSKHVGSLTKSPSSHVKKSKHLTTKNIKDGSPPIQAMGCDVMAHILTFLQPPEILDVLTMPLSKSWRRNFTSQPELWRVLCLVEPFKATIDDPISSSGDENYCPLKTDKSADKSLDKYRLLYTSFVRCMRYVSQIREDAINGRPPAYIDYGISGSFSNAPGPQIVADVHKTANGRSNNPPPPSTLGSNRSLQMFLAQARDVVVNSSNNDDNSEAKTDDTPRGLNFIPPMLSTAARVGTAHSKHERKQKAKKNGPKFGRSMITSRLYSPVEGNAPSNLNLPWSCAIYSIVNWMVAFSDVEGIQTLCLKVLPILLENEQHRLTAQHAGLADVVLRAMVMFSESPQLHIAAFHTIVLLARPHGGREGMMFRTSMTADGIFRGIYQRHGKSGIAVMLDSMRRFQDNATLLAMSCWALVNIALVSDQKAVLVKLGGIQAITNAMYRHPFSAELQFRALFALINLVIPSVQKVDSNSDNNNGSDGNRQADAGSEPEQLGELNETTEKEIIDELVGDVASLVVRVMKNFCSSEAILNRACLVLHNLSLTDEYHVILLWTPQCYQMLEWCVANFRSDQVLQQSATGTLHRLQSTLASDDEMRARFSKSLQTQQQNVTLKQAQHAVR